MTSSRLLIGFTLVAITAAVVACGGKSFTEGEAGTGGTSQGGSSTGGSGGDGATGGSGTGGVGGDGGTGGVGASGGAGGGGGVGASGGLGASGGVGATGGVGASGGIGASGGVAGTGAVGGTAGGTCTDPDGTDHTVRGTTTGTNGTFVDSCDANGNLIEHLCEVESCAPLQDRAPYPAGSGNVDVPCGPRATGRVTTNAVDCSGGCFEGACSWFCPSEGDVYSVLGTETGVATLAHPAGLILECTVLADYGDFDCSAPDLIGHAMIAIAVGGCTISSTEIGIDDPTTEREQDCSYRCTVTGNMG